MDTNEIVQKLQDDIGRDRDDIQELRRDQINTHEEVLGSSRKLDQALEAIEKLEEQIPKLQEEFVTDIESKTSSYVNKRVRKFTSIFSLAVVGTLVSIWVGMWAFQPFRLAVIDGLNGGLRLDEYLAYKINKDTVPKNTDEFTPLRLAITNHFNDILGEGKGVDLSALLIDLRKQKDFNELFDQPTIEKIKKSYAPHDVFNSMVALTFPHTIDLKYKKRRDSSYEMYFYSNDDDAPYLFCAFSFVGTVVPDKIEFDLNGAPMNKLSYIPPGGSSDVYRAAIDLKKGGFTKWGFGVHKLTLRVIANRNASDDDIGTSSLHADCFIAVIGKTDAGRLVAN